jgi:hypothetical protein
MNIFQKRHRVLEGHRGERFTAGQLRVEFQRAFPEVPPTSINAADCFNTPSKKAGCTCKECTRLGGFAVNSHGIVDMGASGFGKTPATYIPTGNTRSGVVRDFCSSAPTHVGISATSGTVRINPQDAAQCIREYNGSFYRGRSNTVLDRQAYSLFKGGLSRDVRRLVEQITFVGEEYGAAQERFGSVEKEAVLIASNLRPIFDKWVRVVAEAKPLIQRIPDQATLDFLFSPFVGTKQWPVWASKTLHFLRPDVFPILDSNAKKPLGLKSLVNSSRGYRQFCSIFLDVLLANTEALVAARRADVGESPTELKLMDKILFEMGLRME